MADQVRVQRNTSATLSATFYAGESPVEADGAVTVTITRPDGTAVATAAATTHTAGTTVYTYVLAPQANLSILTAVWTGTFSGAVQTITTNVEIVGGFYFTLAQLRAMPGLDQASVFSTADLEAARTRAEDYVERQIDAALVGRYGREVHGSSRTSWQGPWLPVRPYVRKVLSLSVGLTVFSAADLADLDVDDWGRVSRRSSAYFGFGRLDISYEHGYYPYGAAWLDSPPTELARAALIRARHDLLGWTSDQPSHPIDVAELGTSDPVAANADMMAGRTQVEEAVKSWRNRITGPVVA